MNKNKRWVYIDLLRVLAIYFVLVVHVLSWPLTAPVNNWNLVPVMIFSKLGVPLFVMLSGAMLIPKKESRYEFFKKRILRLLKPWLFWAFIITLFETLVTHNQSGSFLGLYRFNFVKIWFVPMLFGLYLLTPAIRLFARYAKLTDLWGIILLWFLTVSVWPFFRNTAAFPLISDNGLVRQVIQFSGYYLLGFTVSKTYWLGRKTSWLMVFLGIALTWVMGNQNLIFFDYISPGIILLTTGVYIVIYNWKTSLQALAESWWGKGLQEVGKTSLGIYFLHPMVMYFLVLDTHRSGLINGLLLLSVTYPAVWALHKIPWLKSWVI